ncbi:uncharacterized protein RJT20DRAFT_125483 [Scheffersomyces xylosifermentans]|uniref:uncharacterized protein n=1 Tax=Scheffersomyces xylosifermentans TaxID=1304137 RepID=UPI00315D3C96
MLRRIVKLNPNAGASARLLSSQATPPSHFNNPREIPKAYNDHFPVSSHHPPAQTHHPQYEPKEDPLHSQQQSRPPPSNSETERNNSSLKEITSLFAMCTLAYFAIDNYLNRVKLEKLSIETTTINLKTLQIQQANFVNARKKRDLQILQERRDSAKRDFKMGLHIALLRQQLEELGVEPRDINTAITEFEKNVKADNSVKNVSGQALWLDDSSRMYKQCI